MSQQHRVFFLTRLKDDVSAEDYEAWVRRVDYPIARSQTAITRYEVTRLEGHVDGNEPAPYDYLEVIDITGIDDYRTIDTQDFARLLNEFGDHIGEITALWGQVLGDSP